jgi:hypothetical protein
MAIACLEEASNAYVLMAEGVRHRHACWLREHGGGRGGSGGGGGGGNGVTLESVVNEWLIRARELEVQAEW